jgi:hypothetical protein
VDTDGASSLGLKLEAASGSTISRETGSTGKSWRASLTDGRLGGSGARSGCPTGVGSRRTMSSSSGTRGLMLRVY